MNDEERRKVRDRHERHVCTNGHWAPGICVRCKQGWPCDAARLLVIAEEARAFTVTWAELLYLMPDTYDCQMTCEEANAAADLYRALGDNANADMILGAHAEYDTEEESHYRWTPGDQREGAADSS